MAGASLRELRGPWSAAMGAWPVAPRTSLSHIGRDYLFIWQFYLYLRWAQFLYPY